MYKFFIGGGVALVLLLSLLWWQYSSTQEDLTEAQGRIELLIRDKTDLENKILKESQARESESIVIRELQEQEKATEQSRQEVVTIVEEKYEAEKTTGNLVDYSAINYDDVLWDVYKRTSD